MPKTKVVNRKLGEPYDVYIGRPSKWGNPFTLHRESERHLVLARYRQWLLQQPTLLAAIATELKGKRLGCYCAPKPCHGDVLAELAETGLPTDVNGAKGQ
jgi:hypothetical protein